MIRKLLLNASQGNFDFFFTKERTDLSINIENKKLTRNHINLNS